MSCWRESSWARSRRMKCICTPLTISRTVMMMAMVPITVFTFRLTELAAGCRLVLMCSP